MTHPPENLDLLCKLKGHLPTNPSHSTSSPFSPPPPLARRYLGYLVGPVTMRRPLLRICALAIGGHTHSWGQCSPSIIGVPKNDTDNNKYHNHYPPTSHQWECDDGKGYGQYICRIRHPNSNSQVILKQRHCSVLHQSTMQWSAALPLGPVMCQ